MEQNSMPDGPVITYRAPLLWLDHQEMVSKRWIMAQFSRQVVAFENTAAILEYALSHLTDPETPPRLTANDFSPKRSAAELQITAFHANVGLALDALFAARLMLRSGYFARLASVLRTLIETLSAADICRSDPAKARAWSQGAEIRKRGKTTVHPVLAEMWKTYSFLSKSGVHSYVDQVWLASLSHTRQLEAEYQPGDEVLTAAQKTVEGFIDYINDIAARFLMYIDQTCQIDWSENPEMERRKITILEPGRKVDPNMPYQTRVGIEPKVPDLGEPDPEFLLRLNQLFQEPTKLFEGMDVARQSASSHFLERAVGEMMEASELGAEESSDRLVRGGGLTPKDFVATTVASALRVGFEMGHDYAVRWGAIEESKSED